MQRRGGKRGSITEEQLFFLADVFFLVIISFAFFSYLASLQKDTTFEKNYVARDIASLLMVLQTFEGDGILEYPLPFPLTVELTSNEIIVSEEGINAVRHPFSQIEAVTPYRVTTATKVILTKHGHTVTLT